jgi:hypothetical protein
MIYVDELWLYGTTFLRENVTNSSGLRALARGGDAAPVRVAYT